MPGLRGVKRIVAGAESAMALLEDGTVRAWGRQPAGATTPLSHPQCGQRYRHRGLRVSAAEIAITKDARLIGWDLTDHVYLRPDGSKQQPLPPTEIAAFARRAIGRQS